MDSGHAVPHGSGKAIPAPFSFEDQMMREIRQNDDERADGGEFVRKEINEYGYPLFCSESELIKIGLPLVS